MAMLVMARTTTGWTKNTSCASTISAMKNSTSVPMKVNPMIPPMDEVTLCCMTVFTFQGFTDSEEIHGIYPFLLVNNYTSMKRDFISFIP
jgi:hypothetical protein